MKTGQILLSRQDDIIQRWMNRVQRDTLIDSSCALSSSETLDSLPDILSAIAQVLIEPNAFQQNSAKTTKLLTEALGHGKLRAKQGYDAEEIVWEYAILREIIFQVLSEEINQAEASEIFALLASVNSVVDKVVAFSMKRYADERLRELNVLYDELITSNQELDRIVRNEQSNLAHLAHELKSPLSSIIGYSDLFLKRKNKEEAIHPEYIEQVLTSGRRLLETINNALEMSSYRAGKVSLATQPVDACAVVSEVATALRILAQQKGIALRVECDQTDALLVTDKVRLRQVVTNLLSNAIRYTESGSIQIRTRLVNGEAPGSLDLGDRAKQHLITNNRSLSEVGKTCVEIEVKDTGYGIDVSEQGLIFEPYYQGKAGQQLQSSTGLGLAITHQIVRLLQGSIHLKSEPKVGSTFTILLPLQLQMEKASEKGVIERTVAETEITEKTAPSKNQPLKTEIAKTQRSGNRWPEPILVDSHTPPY